MPADGAPPIRRSAFASRDPAETTEFFRQMYVGNRTSFREIDPRGGFGARFAGTATMRADRLHGSLTMRSTADPLGYLLFGQVQRGRWALHAADDEVRLGPGDSVLYPSDRSFQLEAHHFDVHVIRLSPGRVGALAAGLAGVRAEDLHFESMTPVSPAMGRHFARTLALVHRELGEPDGAGENPLVAEHLAQTAAAVVLATFPNTTMTSRPRGGPGQVAPAALRRAVAYIDRHAGDPVSPSDVAAAAGVSARALQHAFRRHHGTTPMGYLRRARLERAHRELRTADPTRGDTVGAVAARWGFGRPGRFAAQYELVYGRTPDDTLRT